ncbi:MAG: plasmid mobilization relaxosome protein MobC [Clostridia bacterium]|nr:plasmid mobilization relaxosome protein MobC [Clostridia bacterium]
MANRKRNIMIRFRVTPEEKTMIEEKMTQVGTSNMEGYLRKMSIDGYILKLDLPELKEMISLLRRSSNNFNQIAKRMNQTSRIYEADIECLRENQEKLWDMANKILTQLAAIK